MEKVRKVRKVRPARKVRKVRPAMPKDERKWRAEEDARAMMRAEEIKMDKARLNHALIETQRIIKEAEKAVNTAKKVQKK